MRKSITLCPPKKFWLILLGGIAIFCASGIFTAVVYFQPNHVIGHIFMKAYLYALTLSLPILLLSLISPLAAVFSLLYCFSVLQLTALSSALVIWYLLLKGIWSITIPAGLFIIFIILFSLKVKKVNFDKYYKLSKKNGVFDIQEGLFNFEKTKKINFDKFFYPKKPVKLPGFMKSKLVKYIEDKFLDLISWVLVIFSAAPAGIAIALGRLGLNDTQVVIFSTLTYMFSIFIPFIIQRFYMVLKALLKAQKEAGKKLTYA